MMLWLIIHWVYKMFDWFAGGGFRCSSAFCLFVIFFWSHLLKTLHDPMWICINPAILYKYNVSLIWKFRGSILTHSGCSVTFFEVLFHLIIWIMITTEVIYQYSSWPALYLFTGHTQSCIDWIGQWVSYFSLGL